MGSPLLELSKNNLMAKGRRTDYVAAILYVIFSVYLYGPITGTPKMALILYITNSLTAALGAYFISKRWVKSWTPSFFAGAVYGFGPFALSFKAFHPPAGLSFAMVPWLLLPAVYWHRGKSPDALRFGVRAILTLLPFAGITLLFWLSSQQWAGEFHMMMPQKIGVTMTVKDFTNLILPLHKSGGDVVFGLPHCSLIFALMGVFVYLKLQRIALLIPIAVGLVLSFSEPVFQVSPIVWAVFPILFLSVLCGLGFQTFLWAGKADTKWIVICAAAATALAAFTAGIMITPFAGRVFDLTAILYTLAAAALWILLVTIRLTLRWPWFKWAILTAAITIDLLFSARYLIDKF